MSEERPGRLARTDRPWRGDDHAVRVSAGVEVGLARQDVALDSFREGFTAGVTMVDRVDGALVLRGRTVLDGPQLQEALDPGLRRAGLGNGGVEARVEDGEFELRVSRMALMRAGAARPVDGGAGISMGVVAGLALSAVALGLSGLASGPALALSLAGFATAAAGLHLAWARRLVSRRLVRALGEAAHAQGTLLPPRRGDGERASSV